MSLSTGSEVVIIGGGVRPRCLWMPLARFMRRSAQIPALAANLRAGYGRAIQG